MFTRKKLTILAVVAALLLAGALLLPVAIKAAGWVVLQVRIDNCLDSGGQWNSETRTCERRQQEAASN